MAGQSFRFIHASGFQLETTLTGVADVPDHLREVLVAAPFDAVERVTESAIREDVDFVVLTGDILDPTSAGPAALAFLQRQCEQLSARKIPVYWAASQKDLTGDFLSRVQLPDNVRVFPSDRVDRLTHFRGQTPVATLHGRSWHDKRPLRAAEFVREGQEGFQLAVLYARGDLESAPPAGVDYWALGGGEAPRDGAVGKHQVVHSPGRPQGRGPRDAGPRGCTLVSVDGEGEIRIRRIETNAVRWHEERLLVDGGSSLRDLRQSFRTHVERIMAGMQQPALVSWVVAGPGRFDTALVRRKERDEILDWLRGDYGHRSPAAWSLSLELEPPDRISSDWCDDDSILGDFLRTIRERLEEGKTPLDLRAQICHRSLPQELIETLCAAEGRTAAAVLQEAAALGFDLLRGDDSLNRGKAPYASQAELEGVTT